MLALPKTRTMLSWFRAQIPLMTYYLSVQRHGIPTSTIWYLEAEGVDISNLHNATRLNDRMPKNNDRL